MCKLYFYFLWLFHNFYVGAVLLDSDVLSDHIANVRSKIVSKVLATKSIQRGCINLMLIKLNELNRMGYRLDLPYIPRSDFLKQIKPERM